VDQLRLYKISLYTKHKDSTIKDLKFKIQLCFKSPIIKHRTLYTKHLISFLPIPLTNWEVFTTLEVLGGELKMFFELENQRNNMWKFNLNCRFSYMTHDQYWVGINFWTDQLRMILVSNLLIQRIIPDWYPPHTGHGIISRGPISSGMIWVCLYYQSPEDYVV
jgi:hypothetical protein